MSDAKDTIAPVGGDELHEQEAFVEVEGGLKSRDATSAGDVTSERKQKVQTQKGTIYGRPVQVTAAGGSFPDVGSILGPYFCLGQLGKGTFSSIHKCINLQYFHNDQQQAASNAKRRVAAAKVELATFQQSGVLESEAIILDFLHRNAPAGTVPVYMGHFKSDKFSAILMEYLPGEDMHQLRERMRGDNPSRRISTKDAVYFAADVMLPLLRRMHEVGVVHRDVKPSNVVRSGRNSGGESCEGFCMVDFGLSKSIVEPEDSEYADKEHPWDNEWLKPLNNKGRRGYYRKERKKADFRGTSMYASLRVHQNKDYCPRDDIWSLLYVFCDLVSGGLPWMCHAANRDRLACQKFKEKVHGESGHGSDATADLLKGDAYHVACFRRNQEKESKVDPAKLTPLPEPLALSKVSEKVESLRTAFEHLATLQFYDIPNYELIDRCMRNFLDVENTQDPRSRPMVWSEPSLSPNHKRPGRSLTVPEWDFADDYDDDDLLEDDIFDDAEEAAKSQRKPDDFWSRLPVRLRFQLAQLDCNLEAAKSGSVSPHRALRDWMQVVLPLLYEEWNAREYEDGGHRTSTDGFKRERYLGLVEKCLSYAQEFACFTSRATLYSKAEPSDTTKPENGGAVKPDVLQPFQKKRKVRVSLGQSAVSRSELVFVSRAIFGLQTTINAEKAKKSPPPVRISFS